MDKSKIHHVSKSDINNWNEKASLEDIGEYLSSEAGAITSDKIADGAITGDKIADGAITTDKLATSVSMGSIKSVQRGRVAILGTGVTIITISSVDTTKSLIVLASLATRINPNATSNGAHVWSATFTSRTEVSFSGGNSLFNTTLEWQVIEFN